MSREHIVKAGETLGAIAKMYLQDAKKYPLIAAINHLENPDLIHPGQVLIIPEVTHEPLKTAKPHLSATHTVQETPIQAATPIQTATRRDSAGNQAEATSMPEDKQTDSLIDSGKHLLISHSQLEQIFSKASPERIQLYEHALINCLEKYSINTPLRIAHFLAQTAHESACLLHTEENLNYSAKALIAVFSSHFTDETQAQEYARQPEAIANRVYASRLGNGDEASGDGWRFRGRGLIQLTGKSNYFAFSKDTGCDALIQPECLSQQPEWAVMTAGWFWDKHQLNTLADQDNVRAITRTINGGFNGLKDREAYLALAKQSLNIQKAA